MPPYRYTALGVLCFLLARHAARRLWCHCQALWGYLRAASGAHAIAARGNALQRRIYRSQLGGFVVIQGKFKLTLGSGLRAGVFVGGKVFGGCLHTANGPAAQLRQLRKQSGALLQKLGSVWGGV
jgi:hypothetical protein